LYGEAEGFASIAENGIDVGKDLSSAEL